jgi:NAD(P)H dehydrogenase (quinone)
MLRSSRCVFGILVAACGWLVLPPESTPRCAAADEAAAATPPVRVLVVYHSRRGTTEQMAQAAAEGAAEVAGVTATAKKIEEVTKEELQAADGLILGSPTYFANIAGTMKVILDDWNWKWRVDFTDKVGGAFATGGGQTGGKEHVVTSLLLFMLNNRMLVCGPLYQDETGEDIWGEAGSSAMTGPLDPGVGEGEREAARRLGRRVAEVTRRLRVPQAEPGGEEAAARTAHRLGAVTGRGRGGSAAR